jgi:pimeloyl-ACP methyl ester carboxylesterase
MRLVLLHAVTRDRHDWGPLLAALGGFDALPLDLLGHGEAARVPRYTIGELAAAVTFAGPAILYGHSLGGVVALAVAAARPADVRGLVLEDPPLFESRQPRLSQSSFLRGFEALKALLHGPAASWSEDDWAAAVADWPSGHGRRSMREVFGEDGVRRRARQLHRFDPAVLDSLIGGTLSDGFEVMPAIRAAGCPITIFVGARERGSALSEDDVRLLAAEPTVTIVPVPEEGHFIHEILPQPCADAVRRIAALT